MKFIIRERREQNNERGEEGKLRIRKRSRRKMRMKKKQGKKRNEY